MDQKATIASSEKTQPLPPTANGTLLYPTGESLRYSPWALSRNSLRLKGNQLTPKEASQGLP